MRKIFCHRFKFNKNIIKGMIMKFIVLLGLFLGGMYFYSNASSQHIANYQDLLAKAETNDVSLGEIKLGSNLLALQFCNDESYQTSGGKSVKECLKTYANMRGMCEQRIFKNDNEIIESKDKVVKIAKRYTACVGID